VSRRHNNGLGAMVALPLAGRPGAPWAKTGNPKTNSGQVGFEEITGRSPMISPNSRLGTPGRVSEYLPDPSALPVLTRQVALNNHFHLPA
jgi:hypothetical protein